MLNITEEVRPAAACAPCDPRTAQLLELCDALVDHLDEVIVDNLRAMGAPAPGRLRFCTDSACAEGFATDRSYGVIYGTTPEGVWLPHALAAVRRCSYCSKAVPSNAERRAAAQRPTRHLVGGAR